MGKSIDFRDIRNILFENSDPLLIKEYRQRFRLTKDIFSTLRHEHFDINDDFIKNKNSLFSVTIDDVDFECFYQYRNVKKLYINFSGGGRSGKNYPLFLRWRYVDYLNANVLCIDDPMQKSGDNDYVKWYYGTKNKSYLHLLIPLINKFVSFLNISSKDVVFWGSSGGGYAALYMASLITGSSAIAFSPQIVLKNWNKNINKYFMRLGIDLREDDRFGRNVLNKLSPNSLYVYVVNVQSSRDWNGQFLPFCKEYDIEPQYGITQHDNIITWVHSTDGYKVHSSNPETEVVFIDFLIDQYHRGMDINSVTKLSYILNECLNKYYSSVKINKINNVYINTLLANNTKNNLQDCYSRLIAYDKKLNRIYAVCNENFDKIIYINIKSIDICFLSLNKYLYLKGLSGGLSHDKHDVKIEINEDGQISFFESGKYLSINKDGNSFLSNKKTKECLFTLCNSEIDEYCFNFKFNKMLMKIIVKISKKLNMLKYYIVKKIFHK